MNENGAKFELVFSVPDGGGLDARAGANRDALIEGYRAMSEGDPEPFFKLIAEDVVFAEAPSLPYGAVKRGKAEARKGVEGMFSAWSSLRSELVEVLAAGDMAIAYFEMTSVSRATGETYQGPVAEYFLFRDGLVVDWKPIYWDTHAARRACGVKD